MVKRSLSRAELLSKLEEQDDKICEIVARYYLDFFGNPKPSTGQIQEMKHILSNLWKIKNTLSIRLTEREKICLLLAAQGKNIQEIANLLKRSVRRVEAARQSTFKKLGAKNIVEAVVKAVYLGKISNFHYGS